MDVIAKARELGAALQQDERYLALKKAQEANEQNTALNELIAKIQLLQVSFQHEAQKEDKDDAKLQQMDQEFGQIYAQIMADPGMQAYEAAAAEVDQLMKYINAIFTLCLQGEDPATCEPPKEEEHHCGGECSSCGGCH
ncbi:MAG: YlbF family regulator [Clostridia bacterium]|nr:YlbF family regulator [Clostridia bacterium]